MHEIFQTRPDSQAVVELDRGTLRTKSEYQGIPRVVDSRRPVISRVHGILEICDTCMMTPRAVNGVGQVFGPYGRRSRRRLRAHGGLRRWDSRWKSYGRWGGREFVWLRQRRQPRPTTAMVHMGSATSSNFGGCCGRARPSYISHARASTRS